jgi:hypothetical protein
MMAASSSADLRDRRLAGGALRFGGTDARVVTTSKTTTTTR